MSQNSENDSVQEESLLILERMMQNSLLHQEEGGLSPVQMYHLNEMGLVDEASLEEPKFPDTLLPVLLDPEHDDRKSVPDGPLLFLREGDGVSVVEIAPLLLHSKKEVRIAARDLALRKVDGRVKAWSAMSLEAVIGRKDDIASDSISNWRTAGLDLVPGLQADFASQLAGARQCLFTRYQTGIDDYLSKLIQPTLESLEKITPPIWNPSEQQTLIEEKIDEFAKEDTLRDSLDSYIDFCGYLPLAKEQSAAAVAVKWIDCHPDKSTSFEDLEAWVAETASPFAEYHALLVIIHVASLRPVNDWTPVWIWLRNILDVTSSTGKESENVGWRLYCELANHYSRRIESLFPGQRGESIACGAWWLSFQWSWAFGKRPNLVGRLLEHVVDPESEQAYLRWLMCRSPVTPSSFRHCTMNVTSVWAMSLLAQIGTAVDSLEFESAPKETRSLIGSTLTGYVISSPISQAHAAAATFAYEENSNFEQLLGLIDNEEVKDATAGLSRMRNSFDPAIDLGIFATGTEEEPPSEVPFILFLSLKDSVFCSSSHDHTIAQWLQDGIKVSEDLQTLGLQNLRVLLDALTEFYQRNQQDWGIRLPHILAYSIENSRDFNRVETTFFAMLFMCVNGGIISPLERVMSSVWRKDLVEPLNLWRFNARMVLPSIAPWASGRVRSTNAAITRLIGPVFTPSQLRRESDDKDLQQSE